MADNTYFEVYMSDVGLLRRKSNVNYRTVLEGDASYIHFKGTLTENYIMTQLKCMGVESYFWRTKADAEIDFITDYEGNSSYRGKISGYRKPRVCTCSATDIIPG